MSNYRPTADMWILGRPKVRYYGAYPNGFLERARWPLAHRDSPVLHVCAGMVRSYPAWEKLCPNDKTLDLALVTRPDYLQDCRDPLPDGPMRRGRWPGILIDRPYSVEDAKHYEPGPLYLPGATALLRHCLPHVMIGGRVGMLDYKVPRPTKNGARFVLSAGVYCGFDNNIRVYSVFERVK